MNELEEIRRARAYLLRVAEPPAPHLSRFVAQHGPLAAAERVMADMAPDPVRNETAARRATRLADDDLATAAAAGARLLIPEDPDWPAWPLAVLDVARGRGVPWAGVPIALWIRGPADLAAQTERAVAVIGARAASNYGEHIAAEFGHDLAEAGVTVISGAAYGIDAAAHRGALIGGGPTIAVLACGPTSAYPAGHASLLDRIAESGAVISEYPPGTPPGRHRFLVRNRLIAALAAGTVVVEAGRRSGARNTAATAGTLGRMVMAVPGSIGSAMSIGCHDLIRTGEAILVRSPVDVLEVVGPIGADLPPSPPPEPRETDGLDDRSLRIHDALDRRSPLTVDQVALRSGIRADQVQAILPALELRNLATRTPQGWRRATPADISPAPEPAALAA